MDEYSAILFHSPNHAIWTAKLLTREGIENRMIPIPRNLSSDCGYCVQILGSDAERAAGIMKINSIDYDRIEKI